MATKPALKNPRPDLDPKTNIVFDAPAGVDIRGDVIWDSMALAQVAYESLPAATPPNPPWDQVSTFNKEQMRAVAQSVYFNGGGSTAFEVACLVAAGLPDPTPTLASLDPASAVCSDPVDVTMKCLGTNFTQTSVIYFGGREERTDYVSATEVSTIVKPSLFPNPDPNIQVFVRTPHLMDTETLAFAFTVAGTRNAAKKEENGKHKR